ncbi:MAG: sulfatase-like hydrolase/transferase, partial [Planctomycetota bacterium]|nr:sulfatase-like hydrolase/transferase [Planctomycetota bacterium]
YSQFKGQDYAPDRIAAQALRFIEKNKDRPFFLYYPTVIPHLALHVPDDALKPYLALKWHDPPFTKLKGGGYTPHFTPRAAYAAMITRLDTYVGRILDLLEKLNLDDNTIVVFTSDNGTTHLKREVDYDFFASVKPLRGLKGSLYEGGVRVPLIARWPGHIPRGTTSDFVTGFEDWIPTLLSLTGSRQALPTGVDGISLADTLHGKQQPPRPFLYREFAGYGGQQAVWMGQWKGVRQRLLRPNNPNRLKIELFDLDQDISESRDLAAKHPEIVARIRELMKAEHRASTIFPNKALD